MNTAVIETVARFSKPVLDIIADANTKVEAMNLGVVKLRDLRWEAGEIGCRLRNSIEKYHKNEKGLSYAKALEQIHFGKLVSRQTFSNYQTEYALCEKYGISKEVYYAVDLTLSAPRFNPKGGTPAAKIVGQWKSASDVTEERLQQLEKDYPRIAAPTLVKMIDRREELRNSLETQPAEYSTIIREAGALEESITEEKKELAEELGAISQTLVELATKGVDLAFLNTPLTTIHHLTAARTDITSTPLPKTLEGEVLPREKKNLK